MNNAIVFTICPQREKSSKWYSTWSANDKLAADHSAAAVDRRLRPAWARRQPRGSGLVEAEVEGRPPADVEEMRDFKMLGFFHIYFPNRGLTSLFVS